VLNDDEVAAGQGFGRHPHDNMEIVSIPLEGDLEHKDSMGTASVIRNNDVQAMSAGTGIFHSEYNHNSDKPVKFLQIWIFPKLRNIAPRYDQKTFDPAGRKNKLQRIVSPIEDGSDSVKIIQDAYFSLLDLDKGRDLTYTLNKSGNGLYLFMLDGSISSANENLDRRDGMGITDTNEVTITAMSHAEILFMEVPMTR
jgi:redox-sensitive bicupin YhaK (pirin superfamily)